MIGMTEEEIVNMNIEVDKAKLHVVIMLREYVERRPDITQDELLEFLDRVEDRSRLDLVESSERVYGYLA
jgi:hypothetical protein